MKYTLLIIANPEQAMLDDDIIAHAVNILSTKSKIIWRDQPHVAEIYFNASTDFDFRNKENALRTHFNTVAIDFAFVPESGRRKKLLIADMDSTMIGQECIDELGKAAGFGDQIAAITARAMAGELDFEAALLERVSLMHNLDASLIDDIITNQLTFTPGGKTLVATMKAHDSYCALVSGGFRQFTDHVADKLGFDEHQANELLIENGRLTGKVALPILGQNAKVEALENLCVTNDITPDQVIAVGDGANDAGMIKRAGLGVALHGKPALREVADIRIDHGDLTALLYLQGYNQDDFA